MLCRENLDLIYHQLLVLIKMTKINPSSLIFGVLKDEIGITKGAGKFILIAMFFNIPFWGWIPFLSQAGTMLLLFIFLKHTIKDNENKKIAIKSKNIDYTIKKNHYNLIIGTIILQLPLFFAPFFSQFITLFLLGIIYTTMTSYKEKR